MDPIFALGIRLPRHGSRDLLGALQRQLKAAILDGRLQAGLRLPATRVLAAALGVSRNTVVLAYDVLLGEGYLEARRGAGTYVARGLLRPSASAPRTDAAARPTAEAARDPRLNAYWRSLPERPRSLPETNYTVDLRLGTSEQRLLPLAVWQRLAGRALRAFGRQPVAYAQAGGRPVLCAAIAGHVAFARAVSCRPDDVLVTAGAQQAFDLLARVLVTPGRTVVALENPGYPPCRAAFAAQGAIVLGIAVDDEGLCVDRLPPGVGVICVTPSHQFPLGVPMSARRRAALLDYARRHGTVVVEDDYDGEFRFGGQPLDALATLDRSDCVFYVGTFSKSLFPALRIGFVVAPAWAQEALLAAKMTSDWQVPVLAQDTLGAFIAEGHLARHVRKMRRIYAVRRATLLDALALHCGGRLQPIPSLAGLHLSARLGTADDSVALVAQVARQGIGIESLARYCYGDVHRHGIAFSYGSSTPEQIYAAIRTLASLLGQSPAA